MKNIILVIIASILLGIPFELRAQDGIALGREIEKSLKTKENKRKLKESIPAGDHAEQEWSFAGKKVLVMVYQFNSPEEAARHMELAISGIAYAPARGRQPGFGDDAYVSTDNRGTSTWLCFRLGRTYVVVNASSLKVAREFARDIADHLARR